MQRWYKVLAVGLKKGQWTEEEDEIVREAVEQGGGPITVKWADVAEALSGRLGKQVRERWQNHLDPALSRDPWDEAEDQLLISLQAVMGNKWSEIARAFAGRSENSVKNRWNSKQRKSLAAERKLRTGSELGVFVRPEVGAANGEATIKIDFTKALEAAHSPHIVTGAENRRRPLPSPAALAPLQLLAAAVPRSNSTIPSLVTVIENDVLQEAGAVLIELLTLNSFQPLVPATPMRVSNSMISSPKH